MTVIRGTPTYSSEQPDRIDETEKERKNATSFFLLRSSEFGRFAQETKLFSFPFQSRCSWGGGCHICIEVKYLRGDDYNRTPLGLAFLANTFYFHNPEMKKIEEFKYRI